MQSVYNDDEVLRLTEGSYIIHDASVLRFDIYMHEHRLYIDVYFVSIAFKHIKQTKFKLSFIDVMEYDLCWDKRHRFYMVESYKLLKCDEGFYVSLSPSDQSANISPNDEDFILCKNISGRFVETTSL